MIFFKGKYALSAQVKRVMIQAEISEDHLHDMITRAAMVSHPEGNRRFHDWLIRLDGVTVTHMRKLQLKVLGEGSSPIEEECPDCEGEGCAECGWAGVVTRMIDNLAIDCKGQ